MRALFAVAGALLALSQGACATSPLARGIAANDAAQVNAALDSGAKLADPVGEAGMTPLAFAVSRRRPGMVRLLLDRGADVNARRGRAGASALTIATLEGDEALVRLLLSRGAEVSLRELNWAKGSNRPAIAALLREAAVKTRAASPPTVEPSSPTLKDVDAPRYALGERPDDFALVIGIGKYEDAPEAPSAAEDAGAVAAHLAALGWPRRNIVVLSGEGAGRAQWARYLERWLPNNVSDNARFFFYFAGDGAVDASGRTYLLPYDGDVGHLEAAGYPLARLYEKIGALKTRSAVIMLDTGFAAKAGRAATAAGTARPDFAEPTAGRAFVIVPALDGSWAAAAGAHGALTHAFLEGLNASAGGAGPATGIRALVERAGGRLLTGPEGDADLRLR